MPETPIVAFSKVLSALEGVISVEHSLVGNEFTIWVAMPADSPRSRRKAVYEAGDAIWNAFPAYVFDVHIKEIA